MKSRFSISNAARLKKAPSIYDQNKPKKKKYLKKDQTMYPPVSPQTPDYPVTDDTPVQTTTTTNKSTPSKVTPKKAPAQVSTTGTSKNQTPTTTSAQGHKTPTSQNRTAHPQQKLQNSQSKTTTTTTNTSPQKSPAKQNQQQQQQQITPTQQQHQHQQQQQQQSPSQSPKTQPEMLKPIARQPIPPRSSLLEQYEEIANLYEQEILKRKDLQNDCANLRKQISAAYKEQVALEKKCLPKKNE